MNARGFVAAFALAVVANIAAQYLANNVRAIRRVVNG